MLLSIRKESHLLFVVIFVLTTVVASIYFVQMVLHFRVRDAEFPIVSMLISVFASYYFFLLIVPIITNLQKRMKPIRTWKFVIFHFLIANGITVIYIFLISLFNQFLFSSNDLTFVNRIKYSLQSDYITVFIGYCVVLATAYLIHYYNKFGKSDAELSKLKSVPKKSSKHLIIKHKGRFVKVPSTTIRYIESYDNYCKVYSSSDTYVYRITLKELEAKLKHLGHIRIHRSYIVNPKYVAELEKLKNGDAIVRLTTGEKLRLSRSYRLNVKPLLRTNV